jgi:TonB family protein
MERFWMLFVFMLAGASSFAAQKTDTIIKRDTINLRGYIYDESGRPVKFLHIQSTQPDVQYNRFKVNCLTDTNGYFELKGAKFNDTLTITPHAIYTTPPIYNKDSRYIVVYLPAKVADLNSTTPIVISHKRLNRKITPSFKVHIYDGSIDYFDVHSPPRFRGGLQKFLEFIKNNLEYPDLAIKNNSEGTVEIEFTVEKDGRPVNFKILRGIGYQCDEAVVNVLKKSPWWQPAIDNGRPYAMKQTISVKFALTDN